MRCRSVVLWLLAAAIVGCGERNEAALDAATPTESADRSACPATAPAPDPLPNMRPELMDLSYWLEERGAFPPSGNRDERADLDAVLLDAPAIGAHSRALADADDIARLVDLTRPVPADELRRALAERLKTYRELFAAGHYESPRASARQDLAIAPESLTGEPALHVALEPIDLRCAPFLEPILSKHGTSGFDRNGCSQARAQEPIELLGTLPSGMRLARTKNAIGFVGPDAPLSPVVPSELDPIYRAPASLSLTRDLTLAPLLEPLPRGTLLRTREGGAVVLAKGDGFVRGRGLTPGEATVTARPLTRRSFLTEAFGYLGSPYGWGDARGGRDCSRFVLDVLAAFGLTLPRTSVPQSRSGRYTVEVPATTSEVERLALLDAADARGIVLVHFPGHIMFYLGRDHEGVPRALHSFAEYMEPCAGGGETLREVGRVTVSDLSLGKGSSRRSFLERMTHLTVFGEAPGYELLGLARFRAPSPPRLPLSKRCDENADVALFHSPREPDATRPLRVVAASEDDLRPASVWLIGPDGALVAPTVHDLGVGPFARWVEVEAPKPGKWRALVADGDHVIACTELRVTSTKAPVRAPDTDGAHAGNPYGAEMPAWPTQKRWNAATERLFAAFVEQLFSYPLEEVRSFSALSELLQQPQRNLLFDHRGVSEDEQLGLAPDCADLPYLLRAYFAWKLRLPFAFRLCTRGRAGVPPRCDTQVNNEVAVEAGSELDGFRQFWAKLSSGVHSASGRTLPGDSNTDLYPVALDRRALPPGTVFADPYGHMIVVAKWLPQGLGGEGMLLGADAQPDATLGRRRFWRGNFLFTPALSDVGAGFKAFRPLTFADELTAVSDAKRKRRTETRGPLIALDDEAIAANHEFPAPSRDQYQGATEDFYARMDRLIYPRPIAVLDRMRRVIDALEEQVVRRVEAIDVGEAALGSRNEPIGMPEGYAIFETNGAWEDFATPSRDMRLLIAIDVVRAFPGDVRKDPARYGAMQDSPEVRDLDQQLDEALRARHFRYRRSDGSMFELSLADVVARVDALETGYNPNDCVESRWGAPDGSDERAPCAKKSPAVQKDLMERYRSWFHARERPARPAKLSKVKKS